MWLEAILSRGDLTALVKKFTPVTIRLGEDGSIYLSEPSDVILVPDVGVRVVCRANLTWPFLGIRVPIALHSLTVLMRPEIVKGHGLDELAFKMELEHADIAGVPAMIDNHITERVNKELAEKNAPLIWKFSETLSHAFPLPALLEPLEAFDLRVAWGKVKVTPDALVFAVSFHSTVTRHSAASTPPGDSKKTASSRPAGGV